MGRWARTSRPEQVGFIQYPNPLGDTHSGYAQPSYSAS